jgi:DNA polymerase/3'-5' exonuclease PolX
MTAKQNMKLSDASILAERLIKEITPYCVRCEIAGSIRRQKAEVKDIEIVAIPKIEMVPDPTSLFAEPIPVNRLYEWALSACLLWIKPGVDEVVPWTIKPDGKYWRGLVASNTKLDLFLATPENWGIILAIRTGSAEFTTALVTHARHVGMACTEGYLTQDGQRINTPEEEDVFRLLRLENTSPVDRTGFQALKPIETNERDT